MIRKVFVVIIAVFVILYLPFTQYKLTKFLDTGERLSPTKVIVVLGGGLRSDGSAGISTRERVNYGIILFKQGLGRCFIFTGGDKASGHVEAEEMYKLALKRGIPPKAIIREAQSSSTYENAVYTKKILLNYGIDDRVILVTSPYHMRRALYCFKKEGVKVLPAPVKNSEIYTYGFYQNLRNMRLLLHEYLALVYYRLRGYIQDI